MKTLEVSEAVAPLADYLRRPDALPLILTVDGEPVAALVSMAQADLETAALRTSPEFYRILEQSRVRHEAEGGVSTEEMRRRLGLEQQARGA